MTEQFIPIPPNIITPTIPEARILHANAVSRRDLQEEIFETAEDIADYRAWKNGVPTTFRLAVEKAMMDHESAPLKGDGSLIGQFLHGVFELTRAPETDAASFDFDDVVKTQLRRLQTVSVGEESLNIFSALNSARVSFRQKLDWYQKQIANRLSFLAAKSGELLEEYEIEKHETKITSTEESDEYTPHRAPQEKEEGEPKEAIALVYPFFGGYYKGRVFDEYDPRSLTWKQSQREFRLLPPQKIETGKERFYRGSVENNKRVIIKLPYGWSADKENVVWQDETPKKYEMFVDQAGVVSLQVDGDPKKRYAFLIKIGPSWDSISGIPPSESHNEISDRFPSELLAKAEEIMTVPHLSQIIKAKKIVFFIRNHLEYDMDMQWEVVYKADASAYFEKIWEHKKAKCDEANTLAVRLLQKLGFVANFIDGHSVQTKSEKGEAMLLDSNRHAWLEVFDEDAKAWVRLDATPKGDPNVDEEEQDSDLGEGDYGERENELMTEKELEEKQKKFEEQEFTEAEMNFSRETECAPEEARAILKKIETLRKQYTRVLVDAKKAWREIVRKNLRERLQYTGPVPISEGDQLEDIVAAKIARDAGDFDPVVSYKYAKTIEEELIFGGYEVYLAADLSGSMDETIDGVKKSESQRDMAFLFIESIMINAIEARKARGKMKTPMPVRVSLTVFGANTEIVLPLTEKWTKKEQLKVYRALNIVAGGDTPDDLALGLIEREIEESVKQEEIDRKKIPDEKRRKKWTMRRFVVVVADGGSTNKAAVQLANERFRKQGIPVDLFLIAQEEDEHLLSFARGNYQSVSVVPDPSKLAERGLKTLTQRIKEA